MRKIIILLLCLTYGINSFGQNLNEISSEIGGQANFIAVTFNSKEKVENFLSKKAYNFTHVINAVEFMNQIQIQTFPKTIYLDNNGVVKKTDDVLLMDQKEAAIQFIKKLL